MDTAAFEKGATLAEKQLAKSAKNFEKIGQNMVGLGQKLSLGLTVPIVAFGVAAAKAAMESQDAIGQVEAALKSMGDGAGRSAEQLEKLASGIMRKSLFDDDEILRKVTANLLTFGNVSGEQFDRAQQAAVDLAARMKMDLQPAALLVGKALNDPIKGLQSLRRVGIQFTEQQQEQIKAMAAAGDAAGAQTVILKELERQFGGSAAAARKANPLAAMQQAFAEFQEDVGKKLLPLLPRIADAITMVLDAFGKLSPGMQTAVIAFAGIAAAAGPLLIVVGALVSSIAPFLAVMKALAGSGGVLLAARAGFAGLAAVLGPFLVQAAILGTVGYLIYQNWDKIAPTFEKLLAQATALGEGLGLLKTDAEKAGDALRNDLVESGKVVPEEADKIAKAYVRMRENMVKAGTLGDDDPGGFRKLGEDLVKLNAQLQGAADAFDAYTLELAKGGAERNRLIAKFFSDSFEAMMAWGARVRAFLASIPGIVGNMVTGIGTQITTRLSAIWDGAKAKIEQFKNAFKAAYEAIVGHSYIPDMVDGIAAQMQRLDAVMVDPAKTAAERTKQAFEKLAGDVDVIMRRLFPDAATSAGFAGNRASLTAGIAAGGASGYTVSQLQGALKALQSEEFREAFKDFQIMANDNAVVAETANVRIVESFKDMADKTLSALDRMAGAIRGGGFLDILSSVIGLGMQLGSIGVFGKKVQTNINLPRHARGTNFAPGGLSVVGERGPELVNLRRGSSVTPNHKLTRGGNTYYISGNLLTPEFWQQIQAGDMAAVQGGAAVAHAQQARSRKWRLA